MIARERESVEEILGGQVELPPSGGGGAVRQGAKGKHLTDTILDLSSKGFVTTYRDVKDGKLPLLQFLQCGGLYPCRNFVRF